MHHIRVADLDSPSYFVATAAVELGSFKREGIDIEFVYNTRDALFYDAGITREAIDGVMKSTKGFGLVKDVLPYEAAVATEFSALWKE